jgi:hypothetical protein
MALNSARTRALTTLLRWRGGAITLADNDATNHELQNYLQQLATEGLIEVDVQQGLVTYRLAEVSHLMVHPE